MNYWYLVIPILSAMLGWICSRAAFAFLLNNVIPSRKTSIAESIGQTVASAISFDEIENKIADPQTTKKVMPLIESHIDHFLRIKLKEKMPVVSMFIGNKTVDSMKEIFLKEIEELFPQVLNQFTGNLRAEMDIAKMVTAKITNVSAAQLRSIASPALKYFQIYGLATGFVIGLINLLLIFFLK